MKTCILILIEIVIISFQSNAQWEKTKGPIGGSIQKILEMDNILFAASDKNIYISKNYGQAWELSYLKLGSTDGVITELITAFNIIERILYIGTNQGNIFISKDMGVSWQSLETDFNKNERYGVEYIILSGQNLIVSLNKSKVFYSNNFGKNWTLSDIKTNRIGAVHLLNFNEKVFAAAHGRDGLFYSVNNGMTWNKIGSGLPIPYPNIYGIYSVGSDIILATEIDIYISKDEGYHWEKYLDNKINNKFLMFDIDHIDSTIFIATSKNGILISTNGGNSYYKSNNGLSSHYVRDILVYEKTIYIGSDAGVYLSKDMGKTWVESNSGIASSQVISLFANDKRIFAGTRYHGLQYTDDKGITWHKSKISYLENNYCGSFISKGSYLFYGTARGIYRSEDNGQSWSLIGLESFSIKQLLIDGANIIAATFNGLYISDNDGLTWIESNSGLTDKHIVCVVIFNDVLVLGSAHEGLFISKDHGKNWLPQNEGLVINNFGVGNIIVFGSEIFLNTFAGGVFRTDKLNGTWSSLNEDLPEFQSLGDFNIVHNILFLTTEYGIYYLLPSQKSWKSFNEGLTDDVSKIIQFEDYLFSSTSFLGVWKRNIEDLSF